MLLASPLNSIAPLLAEQPAQSFFKYGLMIGAIIFMLAAIVLVWTRWGAAKPIWKCVALSLFAHVLLGGYAYGTRLFFAQPSAIEDQPISFKIMDEETETLPNDPGEAEAAAQPWEKFVDEKSAQPKSADPAKLTQHSTELPQRVAPKKELTFQQPDLTSEMIESISNKPNVRNSEFKPRDQQLQESSFEPHPFEIAKSVLEEAQPARIDPPIEPVAEKSKADTADPVTPSPVEIAKSEIRPSPAKDALEEIKPSPQPATIDTQATVDGLRNDIAARQTPPVEGPQDVVDPTEHIAPINRPWRSASWSNTQQEDSTTQPTRQRRRLGDGMPIPQVYQNRFAKNRQALIEQAGGSRDTERAVELALKWFASKQADDGSWNPREYNAGEETNVLGHNRSGAGYYGDSGITGLIVLTFLGAGHTHLEGEYQKTVQKALEYLIRTQNQDGSLYGNAGLFARTYCHAMALLATSEALAITGDHRMKPFVIKAQNYTIQTQNQTTGGWRYRPGDDGDMSQFGWQVLALKSTERAGIPIPAKTRRLMIRFLTDYSKGKHGGISSYRPAEQPTRTMTAEALLCKRLLGLNVTPEMSREAVGFVMQETPGQTNVNNLYYWYYATLSLHQEQEHFEFQKANWNRWNEALTTKLLNLQDKSQNAGSFSEKTLWGSYGGKYYSTAMSTLSLEIYYRYQPAKATTEKTARQGFPPVTGFLNR